MPEDEGLDAARRMADLFGLGVPSGALSAAVGRSVDVQDLRKILGFIEDLLDSGYTIEVPE